MSERMDEPPRSEVENEAAERPLLERWAKVGEDYVVNKLIGRGGQSQIYEGYDTRNERLVAIKVFLFKHQLNAAMLKRARAEAKAEMRMKHPNIVKVHAAGVDEIRGPDGKKRELFYSVMEFLEGETLEDRIHRKGRLDVAETLSTLAEVADGLAMLHASHIIHRDIKPENIFLAKPEGGEGPERVVLIDLGIAKLDPAEFSVQRTDTNILLGTFAYMSPEQIHHNCPVDGRADLYALGIVAFKCLAGVHPAWNHYEQPNPPPAQEYAAWHMAVTPPLVSTARPEVPKGVAALVARLLRKAPEDRYPDAKIAACEAAADLRLQLDQVKANPPPPPPIEINRRLLAAGITAPADRWGPIGNATTQEDEGNDGPTAAGVVPVRMRDNGPAAPQAQEVAPAPALVPPALVPPALVPPPRGPLRTTAGTEILEASAVLPAAQVGRPPQVGAAAGEVARTRSGTEIVPREPLSSLATDATPLDLSNASHELAAGVAAPSDPATRVDPGPRGKAATVPFRAVDAVSKAAREARTTSAHLTSVAPPPRASSRRFAWGGATVVGVLCGVLVLALGWWRVPPSSSVEPIAVALPDQDAGVADAAVGIAAPDASAEAADASAEAADATPGDAGPETPDAEPAQDAGAKPARPLGQAPPGKRVCDFAPGGCVPDGVYGICEDDPTHPRCNRGWAAPGQRVPAKPVPTVTTRAPDDDLLFSIPKKPEPPKPSADPPKNRLPKNAAPQPLPPRDRIQD